MKPSNKQLCRRTGNTLTHGLIFNKSIKCFTCSDILCAASLGSWHWLMTLQISWLFIIKLMPSVVSARNESWTLCNWKGINKQYFITDIKKTNLLNYYKKMVRLALLSSSANNRCENVLLQRSALKQSMVLPNTPAMWILHQTIVTYKIQTKYFAVIFIKQSPFSVPQK